MDATCHMPLSLGQMARTLRVTSGWLKAEAEAGRVPALKAGNRFLFDRDAVIAEIARRAATERQGGADDAR